MFGYRSPWGSILTCPPWQLISCCLLPVFFLQAHKTHCLSACGWLLDELPASPPPPRCSLFYRRQEKTNGIIPPLAPAKRLHRRDFEESWDVADGLDLKLTKKNTPWGSRRSWWLMGKSCDVVRHLQRWSLLGFCTSRLPEFFLFPPHRVAIIRLAVIRPRVKYGAIVENKSIIFRRVLLPGDTAKRIKFESMWEV